MLACWKAHDGDVLRLQVHVVGLLPDALGSGVVEGVELAGQIVRAARRVHSAYSAVATCGTSSAVKKRWPGWGSKRQGSRRR